MGTLSTHVLDTTHGRPAAGMRVALYRLDAGVRAMLVQAETDHDGRIHDALAAAETPPGIYELDFSVADYFRARGLTLPDPPFLGVVTLRFGLAAQGHHHVPLLVSPFGYTSYRGS